MTFQRPPKVTAAEMVDPASVVRLAARPTTYKGIAMRSRLEARYAAWLDKLHMRWEYEPRAFADATRQYLPDFLIHDVVILGSPRRLYVDVKPTEAHATGPLRHRMAVIWESDPDCFLAVEAPDSSTLLMFPPCLKAFDNGARFVWAMESPSFQPALVPAITRTWCTA